MGIASRLAMLATLGGTLALVVGLVLLVLPLLVSELSRPRDSAWGGLVLLLGLVLVTSAERLSGEPMLAVLLGGLLVGRLGSEVAQARWMQLTLEERQRLASAERWSTSFNQLGASIARLLQMAAGVVAGLAAWIAERRKPPTSTTKRWVRPESPAAEASSPSVESPPAAEPSVSEPVTEPVTEPAPTPAVTELSPEPPSQPQPQSQPSAAEADPPADRLDGGASNDSGDAEAAGEPSEAEATVVSGFAEIDALLAATPTEDSPEPPGEPEAG